MQVRTCFRTRGVDLKTKTSPATRTLKPDSAIQSLKKLKSSRLQMFFKIGSIKNFAILTGKQLCLDPFLIKLQV